MKEKRPAFQFYPGDFLGDERVAMMDAWQTGVYIRLLCHCWREGSIPKSRERALVLGAHRGEVTPETLAAAGFVLECFKDDPKDPERLIHGRLELERKKQADWARKCSLGGKRSGQARRVVKVGSKGSSTKREVKGNSSSSSSSSSSKEVHTPEAFASWYALYPRKVSRTDAEKAFRQVIKTEADLSTLMRNTPLWAASYEAEAERKGTKQYIKHPASFLRAGTWREPPDDNPKTLFEPPAMTLDEARAISKPQGRSERPPDGD